MSKSTITIDPVTRIEGHLAVRVEQEDGLMTQARCSGTLFRGLEIILQGRDPRDAPILTQRICGVCPQAHATASARALDEAFGLKDRIPPNGALLRDIMLGANFLQSHILHFYHLAALDYVDVTAVKDYTGNDSHLLSVKDFIGRGSLAPFVPRYEGDYRLSAEENMAAVKHYVEALEARKNAHELLAIARQANALARLKATIRGPTAHIVRQPDRADAQLVQHSQDVEAPFGAVGVFDRQHESERPVCSGLQRIVGTAHNTSIDMVRIDVAQQIAQSIQSVGQVVLARKCHIDGKEANVDAGLTHLGKVDLDVVRARPSPLAPP